MKEVLEAMFGKIKKYRHIFYLAAVLAISIGIIVGVHIYKEKEAEKTAFPSLFNIYNQYRAVSMESRSVQLIYPFTYPGCISYFNGSGPSQLRVDYQPNMEPCGEWVLQLRFAPFSSYVIEGAQVLDFVEGDDDIIFQFYENGILYQDRFYSVQPETYIQDLTMSFEHDIEMSKDWNAIIQLK